MMMKMLHYNYDIGKSLVWLRVFFFLMIIGANCIGE